MCCVTKLTPQKSTKKVELTNSGKFIEVERAENEIETTGNGKVECESETEKSVTVTPNASPGKTVRIKENGAKANGDAEVVRIFVVFLLK